MIEYKFRGKRVDNGEWVYGKLFFLDNPDFYSILPVGGLAFPEVSTESETGRCLSETGRYLIEPIEVIPETVGQYTGLHDKNSVEIYEDDKVWCRAGEHRSGVWEYEKQFIVEYGWSQSMWEMSMCDEIEVIGNIHDKE